MKADVKSVSQIQNKKQLQSLVRADRSDFSDSVKAQLPTEATKGEPKC